MFCWTFLAEVCQSKLHEIVNCCVYLLLVSYNGHVNTKFIIYLLLSYFIPIAQLHISSLKWGKYFKERTTGLVKKIYKLMHIGKCWYVFVQIWYCKSWACYAWKRSSLILQGHVNKRVTIVFNHWYIDKKQ